MAHGWFRYWSDFWEKDPVDDHIDNWDAAINTVLKAPAQEVLPLDITKEDLQVAIKNTPKNSARGLCGWNIREISILPDQFLDQLVTFFHLCIDTDWPDVFSQVRVSLPPKNDNPHKPKDGRPICIFSQVYRNWARNQISRSWKFELQLFLPAVHFYVVLRWNSNFRTIHILMLLSWLKFELLLVYDWLGEHSNSRL